MSDKATLYASIGRTPYTTTLTAGNHTFLGDEPTENGGQDAGFSPSNFLLSALATCTAATLRMYADRKGWDLEKINLELSLSISKNEDGKQVTHIARQLSFEGNLDDTQRKSLLNIANKCPIHKILTNEIMVETTVQ